MFCNSQIRGSEGHINMRLLHAMVAGSTLALRVRTRM